MKATTELSDTKIGQLTGLHGHSVSRWVGVYQSEGFEAVCQFNYGTNKSELANHSQSLLSSFTQRPPMTANEAKARIEELTGISRSSSQVRNFMKRHGLRYLQTGHMPAKADIVKQQEWVKEKLAPAIEEAKKEECHLLFMDAAHFIITAFYLCFMVRNPLVYQKS